MMRTWVVLVGVLSMTVLVGQGQALTFGQEVATSPAAEKATYLGLSASPVPEMLRAQFKLEKGQGLMIDFVEPGTPVKSAPAAAAGLRTYDILMKLDDQVLVNAQQVAALVRMRKPGDTARFTVIREGKETQIPVTLGETDVERVTAGAVRYPGSFGAIPPGAGYGGGFGGIPPGAGFGGGVDPATTVSLANREAAEITRQIRIIDSAGRPVFLWPPEEVRKKLEALPGRIETTARSLTEALKAQGLDKDAVQKAMDGFAASLRAEAEKAVGEIKNDLYLENRLSTDPSSAVAGTGGRGFGGGGVFGGTSGRGFGGTGSGIVTCTQLIVATGDGSLTFSVRDGGLYLEATRVDKDERTKIISTHQVFAGPVQTDEQRKALPADLAKRLEKVWPLLSVKDGKLVAQSTGAVWGSIGNVESIQVRTAPPSPAY